jgi:alkaline phosphatase
MRINRIVTVSILVVMALVMTFAPASAQEEALPVLILPVDQAQFLPGAYFDFRIEVQNVDELPENFSVTINGTPAEEFFGTEGTEESWQFGGDVTEVIADGVPADTYELEQLAGEYYNSQFGVIAIEVDGETVTGTLSGETFNLVQVEGDAVAFEVEGGAADGQILTFGFSSEDSSLTGFTVAGQDFGILTELPTPVASIIWRQLQAPEAGEYIVEVTANGTTETVTWTVRDLGEGGGAQNVILFIADGMTVAQITAARIASRGINEGLVNDHFNMDEAEYIGLAQTSSVDSLMADSANTASALNTGHIGMVNATGSYADTSPDTLDDPRVETFGEMLKRTRGYAVGVVTTADFSDATPAAVWAYGRNRSDFNRAAYVSQALEFGAEVYLGGGIRRLLPRSAEGSRRSDDRDMIAEFEAAGYTYVTSQSELDAAVADAPEKLLGLFHPSDMNVWLDRNVYTDNLGDFTDQPGLPGMTLAALEVLKQNENGFYLQVEAASVDKQMHPLDQERALSDLIEFDMAIGAAMEWVEQNAPDTLIVITADHGHGYDVYGTVDVTEFNEGETDLERREAIRVYGAADYPTYTDEDGDGFPNWEADIVFAGTVNNGPDRTENFQVSPSSRVPAIQNEDGVYVDNPEDDPNGIAQQGNLDPASSTGVHTLQDVPVFAMGPGAAAFGGVYHQREVFFGMAAAIGLDLSETIGEGNSGGDATPSAPAATEDALPTGEATATDEAAATDEVVVTDEMMPTEEAGEATPTEETTPEEPAATEEATAGVLSAGIAGNIGSMALLLFGLVGGFLLGRRRK